MMHHCNYCSESFFSGYSLMSHMRVHNKEIQAKGGGQSSTSTAFPGFVPPSSIVPGQPQIMDYSWHQSSWSWANSSSSGHAGGGNPSTSTKSLPSSGEPSHSNNSSQQLRGSYEDEDSSDNSESSSGEDLQARLIGGGPVGGSGGGPLPSGKKSGKVYECPSCKKIFRSYPGLRYHRNSKHDQNGPYKCAFCEKRFCQKSHLSRHETLHTGEKAFACSYCDKTFRIKGNLQIHVRIHTGEKPYACSTCGKKFTQQQSAKSHEKLHLKYK